MSLIKRASSILLVVISASFLFGCTFCGQSISLLRSTDHFIAHKNDPRILFEPGAEDYADRVALFLPSAIQQIEKMQYRSFVRPVAVYVCASRESFCRMYGIDCRAGVLKKLFLSPRLFDEQDTIIKLYLTHELSHLHLLQQIGVCEMRRLPVWFKEGLATYVSGGGGAHTITDIQARDSIKAGKCFVPSETDGLVFQKTASDWHLRPHMFYRQSMTFISYLAAINEPGFRKLILSAGDGERFPTALQAAYDKKLEELWNGFLHEINKMD